MWCCYAWPQAQGNSGKRTFFINQGGDVLSCLDVSNNGTGNPIAADDAFLSTASGTMDTPVAANTLGHNTLIWTVVN